MGGRVSTSVSCVGIYLFQPHLLETILSPLNGLGSFQPLLKINWPWMYGFIYGLSVLFQMFIYFWKFTLNVIKFHPGCNQDDFELTRLKLLGSFSSQCVRPPCISHQWMVNMEILSGLDYSAAPFHLVSTFYLQTKFRHKLSMQVHVCQVWMTIFRFSWASQSWQGSRVPFCLPTTNFLTHTLNGLEISSLPSFQWERNTWNGCYFSYSSLRRSHLSISQHVWESACFLEGGLWKGKSLQSSSALEASKKCSHSKKKLERKVILWLANFSGSFRTGYMPD